MYVELDFVRSRILQLKYFLCKMWHIVEELPHKTVYIIKNTTSISKFILDIQASKSGITRKILAYRMGN